MKLILLFAVTALLLPSLLRASQPVPPLPVETSKWLDGKPIQWNQLKGKVVLLNVWTFGCWNSYRSLPWLVSIQKKFPELQIIGIHSPEFDHEKDRSQLRKTMEKYGIQYPQVLDDNHAYWNALHNRYWPAFYIVDGSGQLRGEFFGETHTGDNQAAEIEKLIAELSARL